MITKVRLFVLIAALILSSFANISSTPNAARAWRSFKFSMVEGSWAQVQRVVPAGAQIDPYSYELKSDNNIQIVTACDPVYRTTLCWDMSRDVFSETTGTFASWVDAHRDTIWLIGNELNPNPGMPRTDAQLQAAAVHYAKFYKWVADTIKSVTGTTTPNMVFCQAMDTDKLFCELAYTEAVKLMGHQNAINAIYAISTHNYVAGWDFLKEGNLPGATTAWISRMNDFANWANTVDGGALANKPLWLTEFGSLDAWCPESLPGAYGCPAKAGRDLDNGAMRMFDDYVFYGRNNREGLWGVQHATIDYFTNPNNEPGKNQGDWQAAWWFRNEMGDWNFDGKGYNGECDMTAWLFGDNTFCTRSTGQVSRAGRTYYYEISPSIGPDLVALPDVKGNYNGWNSTIIIRNNAEFATNASIRFYNASGGSAAPTIIVPAIAPNGTEIVDVSTAVNNFSGSAIVTADRDVEVVVTRQRSPAPYSSSAYDGIRISGASRTYYVPQLLHLKTTASGQGNGRVIVQNFSASSATVTTQFFDAAGNLSFSRQVVIGPYGGDNYGLDNLPAEWYGSAIVSADAGGKIAVIVDLTTGSDGLQTFNAFPAESAGTTWLVPLFTSRLSNGLSTPITFQNVSGGTIPVGGLQLACQADPASPGPRTINTSNTSAIPNIASYFFNPVTDTTFPTNWYGSCRITATGNGVSFISARYVGVDLSSVAAYEAVNANGTSRSLVFPRVAERPTSGGFATSVSIQNLSATTVANVALTYWGAASCGSANVGPLTFSIPAGGSLIRNQRLPGTDGLPAGWCGSLTVTSSDQPIDGFIQLTDTTNPPGDTFMAHNAIAR